MAGQIQSSINNILDKAAIAKKLDPKAQLEAQKQAELETLDARESALGERNKALVEAQKGRADVDNNEMRMKLRMSDLDEAKNIGDERFDIAKKRFELSPSKDTYDAYAKSRVANKNFNDFYNARKKAYDEGRQQQAMADMQSQAEAKKKLRRNFMDYIGQQPTSLGGTVGELPKDMQKQIASQYSKGDRKRMMDSMDKEKADGKQQ